MQIKVFNNDINSISSWSENFTNKFLPKAIHINGALKIDDISLLINSYLASVLTFIDISVKVNLPQDFTSLDILSDRAKKILV